MLWQFGGQIEQERIAYGGLALASGASLEDDDAERLLLAAAETGRLWHDAESEVDTNAVADQCETQLLERLSARFEEERTMRAAEQDDRAVIQLRTLEQRLAGERSKQMERIEQQRRRIDLGTARGRNPGSVIAMAEGKLKKLEERAAIRRAEIERARRQTAEMEQLAVGLIEVTP
jgi:hypothetical protein